MNKPARIRLDVILTEEQVSQLEGIAAAGNETAAEVTARAVAHYIAKMGYHAYVEEGETDVREGRVRPWDEAEAELDTKFGPFDD